MTSAGCGAASAALCAATSSAIPRSATFTRRTLDAMLDVALRGIAELVAAQSVALAAPHPALITDGSPA